MNEKPAAVWFRRNPRLGGAIFAAACFTLVYWSDGEIMDKARMGQPVVSLSAGYAALTSIGFIGLASVLFGEPLVGRMQDMKRRRKTSLDYLLIGAIIVPGLAAFAYLKYRLGMMGYR
jgi:hypothetical protein